MITPEAYAQTRQRLVASLQLGLAGLVSSFEAQQMHHETAATAGYAVTACIVALSGIEWAHHLTDERPTNPQ